MSIHKSVLLRESVESLNLKEGSVVVDATLGQGGHSRAILEKIGESGKLIALDVDEKAIENFRKSSDARVILVKDNFANLKSILENLKIEKVDAVLADLGYSSDQLEDENIGISFQQDAALDMRISGQGEKTAKLIANEYCEEELTRIIKEYGEERYAKIIARAIKTARKKKVIETTTELKEIIEIVVGAKYRKLKIHPATRTFQAIRIEVNQELPNLKKFVTDAIEKLSPSGRLAVISFHSLEDRIVKNILRENARGCICPANFPACVCGEVPRVKVITRKPILPSEDEIRSNPRSRSAKLRVCEKI